MSKATLTARAAARLLKLRALRSATLASVVSSTLLLSGCEPEPRDGSASSSQDSHLNAAPPLELQWALPSNDDEALGDPQKIVNNQRFRLLEFQELTAQALKLRPEACDTDERSEMDGEVVPLTVFLPEQPFDFRRYRHARDERARLLLKEERQAQLTATQEPVARAIEALGGLVTGYEYALNALDADVPICELDKLAALDGIVGIEVETSPPVPAQSYVDGIERRNALGLPNFGHPIFNGSSGSTRNSGSAVRFGVIEVEDDRAANTENYLNTSHASFKGASGNSRIVDTDICKFWFPSYRCINSAAWSISSHGTLVTSIILSDFSSGQSSTVTNPTLQHRRSGIAPKATVHYYRAGAWRTVRSGVVESSLEDGVDIINMSIVSTNAGSWCTSPTLSGLREAFEAAVDAGVFSIASAGNSDDKPGSPPCNVSIPATYTSTVSVGATAAALSLHDLESVAKASFSSRGTATYTIAGGRSVPSPLVDIMANGYHKTLAGDGVTGTFENYYGTSFSAPVIAGVTGLLKHWVAYRGGLPQSMANDPVALRSLLMLMGDGRGDSMDQLGDRDSRFGFGNLRFVDLDSDLGVNGSWGIHRFSGSTGTVAEWNIGNAGYESANLKGFKAVAIADRDNRTHSPDISFQLIDKCHSSGNFAVLSATRSSLQWRLRAWESLTSYLLHNRCLWLRATVDAAVSSTNVYVAWVLYSNDRLHHDASNF